MKDTQTNIQGLTSIFHQLLKTNRNTKTCKVFTFNRALYLLLVTEHKDKRKDGCELVNISGFGLTEFIITCGTAWSLRIHGETLFEIKDTTQYFLSNNWPNEFKINLPLFVGNRIVFYGGKDATQKYKQLKLYTDKLQNECVTDGRRSVKWKGNIPKVMSNLENGLVDLNKLTKTLNNIKEALRQNQEDGAARETKNENIRNENIRLKKENDALLKTIEKTEKTLKNTMQYNKSLTVGLKQSDKQVHRLENQLEKIKETKKSYQSLDLQRATVENCLKKAENTLKEKKEKIGKLFDEKRAKDHENLLQEKRIKKLEKDLSRVRDKLEEKNKEYELLDMAWKSISNEPRKKFFDIVSKVCPYHDVKDLERLVKDIKILYNQCNTKDDIFFVYRHLHLNKEDKESCQDYIDRLETMYECMNAAKPPTQSWRDFATRVRGIEERFKTYRDKHVKTSLSILKEHRTLREFGLKNLIYAYTYEYVLKSALDRFQSHRDELTGLFDTISKRITGNVCFFQNGEISCDAKVLCQMYASIMARNYLFRQEFDVEGEMFDEHRKNLWSMKTSELLFSKITNTLKHLPKLEKESMIRKEEALSMNTGIRMYESPIGHTSFSWMKWQQPQMVGHTKFSSGHSTFTAYQIIPKKKGFFKVEKHAFITYKHISIRNMRTVVNRRFKNDITTPVVFFHANVTVNSLEIQDIQCEDTFLDSLQKQLYFYTCFKNFK